MSEEKTKVLIVDDSLIIHNILKEIFETEETIEVIGCAPDPVAAWEIIKKTKPDVITLDIEMPKMDGLTFLRQIMDQEPVPVVMISSLTLEGAKETLEALELGAVDYIPKPRKHIDLFKETQKEIIDKIKSAAKANLLNLKKGLSNIEKNQKLEIPKIKKQDPVIVIGASTGGAQAIEAILKQLHTDVPPIAIVQHMPVQFTYAYAERVNRYCSIEVKEAEDGDKMDYGKAYIAKGDQHLLIQKKGSDLLLNVKKGPANIAHTPSIDVLFKSAANTVNKNVIAVILTGMGNDGQLGMKHLKNKEATTIAQDQTTSVVFSMPQAVISSHLADYVLPLNVITETLNQIRRL